MISIIIPVHNRKQFTAACLNSLSQQTLQDFEVIVVDDGSTDGTAALLEEQYPEVVVLKGDGNMWWAAAVNAGVKHALNTGADTILTLNNDTLVPPSFLEVMQNCSEKFTNALLGAKAIDAHSGEVVYAGERINWRNATYDSFLVSVDSASYSGMKMVTQLPGRGLWIPRAVFEQIGLFDELHLPHYLADFDFTHRAIDAGFDVLINYDVELLIYPGESQGNRLRWQKSLRNYWQHLFGVQGSGNLRSFSHYAMKNCPRKWLPSFLVFGILRRIFGYWMR